MRGIVLPIALSISVIMLCGCVNQGQPYGEWQSNLAGWQSNVTEKHLVPATYHGSLLIAANVTTTCPPIGSPGYACAGATGAMELLSANITFSNLTIGESYAPTDAIFNYSCITFGDAAKWKPLTSADETAAYHDNFTRSPTINSGYYADSNGKPTGIFFTMYTGDYALYNKYPGICYLASYPDTITDEIIHDLFTKDFNNTQRLATMSKDNAISIDGETIRLSRMFVYTNEQPSVVYDYTATLKLNKD